MSRLMTVRRAPAHSSHMRPGPAFATLPPSQCDNNGPGMLTIVPVMWASINMFYPVLINTHTRWHAQDTGDLHLRYVTQLASCQQHFLGSGTLTIMLSSSDMHQTTMITFSRLLVMVARLIRGAELKTSCGVTSQGDNALSALLVIVFLHSW